MDFQNILLLAVTIINLIWGILILSQSKGKKENIFFSLVVFSVVSWSIAMMGYRWASNNYTLIWCRFLYVTAVLIPLFFLFFNYLFPKQKEGFKIQQAIFISLPAVALILLTIFSDTIIANAYRIPHQENKIIFGSLYLFYVAYIVGYFNWSFFHLITNYKKYTGVIKAQIRYIFLGAFMASFVAMATNLLLPWFNYFVFNWFGQFSTVLWVSFTSYAIIRYRLMDIRIIVRNVAVYFGISLIAYGFFYFLIWFYDNFFGGSYSLIAYAVGLIIAPVFVAILLSVYRLLLFVANKYLFSSLSSYQETMAKLIKELNYSIDLQKITDLIVNTIKQTMQLNRAGVLLLDKSQSPDLYRIAKVIGFNEQNGISLVRDNFLTKYLEKTKLPLVSDELILLARDAKSKKEQESFERLYEHMEHIEASLCLPLISNRS